MITKEQLDKFYKLYRTGAAPYFISSRTGIPVDKVLSMTRLRSGVNRAEPLEDPQTEFENKKNKPKPFTKEEEKKFQSLYYDNPISTIAEMMDRQEGSLWYLAKRLGLKGKREIRQNVNNIDVIDAEYEAEA